MERRVALAGRACVALLVLPLGGCSDDDPIPPDGSFPVVEGRVVAVGPESVEGLTVTWRWTPGSAGVSAPVAADGRFEIQLKADGERGELQIDGPPPRTFHPFLYPFHVDSVSSADLILLPSTWTVEEGEYQGEVVETSLDPVMDDDAGSFLYSYFWGQGHPRNDPQMYRAELVTWSRERFPVEVAFDHANSTAELSATDSASVWEILDRMEALFGIDLFEPVPADPGWWPDPWVGEDPGFRPGVIRIVHDPPLWGGLPLGSEEPVEWAQDLGDWAAGGRFTAFEVSHRFLEGGLLLLGELEPLQLADGLVPWETVLTHEMLHILGAGHTCRIPSPQGPCQRTAEVSVHDVAYLEVLRRTMVLERERGSFLGLMPAAIGERRILLGLPALPTLPPRS